MNKIGYVVVDIGSSGIKGALYVNGGEQKAIIHSDYLYLKNSSPYVEIDSRELMRAVLECIRQLAAEAEKLSISVERIGFSSQLGLVGLDSNMQPVTPIITWADNRAKSEAKELSNTFGTKLSKITCRKITGETPSAKILWIKRNTPELFYRVKYYVSVKDMMVAAFTGKLMTDPTHACYTGLFSVEYGVWSPELTEACGISLNQLPPVEPGNTVVGGLLPDIANEVGLKSGIPVINGGPDGTLGCLGCRTKEGVAANIVGTTDVIFTCIKDFKSDGIGNVITNRDVLSGRWIIGGPLSITGGMLAWLMKMLAGAETYDSLEKKAGELEIGSGGIMCIPAMTGTRAPRWDSNIRSAFVGITQEHGLEHLYRAILEGTSYMAYQMISYLKELDVQISEVRMAGGGAKSKLWGEIRANMFNIPLRQVPNHDATLSGLGFLCEMSFGSPKDIELNEDNNGKLICPDLAATEQYSVLCKRYEKLYQALVKAL